MRQLRPVHAAVESLMTKLCGRNSDPVLKTYSITLIFDFLHWNEMLLMHAAWLLVFP